jgi:hypothetical protein
MMSPLRFGHNLHNLSSSRSGGATSERLSEITFVAVLSGFAVDRGAKKCPFLPVLVISFKYTVYNMDEIDDTTKQCDIND